MFSNQGQDNEIQSNSTDSSNTQPSNWQGPKQRSLVISARVPKSKMPFTFQLIVGSKQLHQNESCCASLLAVHAKCLSHEAGCVSLLAARVKSLKSNEAHMITPSLSIKFIGASTSIADFQLIVDLFLNPHREGVEYFCNVSCNKLRRLIVEYIFIVEFSQQHQSTFQQDLADAW